MVNKLFTTFGMSLVLATSIYLWPQSSSFSPYLAQTASPAVEALEKELSTFASLTGRATIPALLSTQDAQRYQAVFQAQKGKDWAKADEIMAGIGNRILIGHVLAERYLHPDYKSKPAELAKWLNSYADHPQAYAVYTLAMAKSPASKTGLETVRKPASLSGYGTDESADLRFPPTGAGALWRSGLTSWRAGKAAEAGKSFTNLANNKGLTPWQSSAASYWAWRALTASGQENEAEKYLNRAAENKYSFYGLLARKQLGLSLDVDTNAITLTEGDMLAIVQEPTVRRIIALTQAGAADLAERELRVAFPQADDQDKLRLLALAHELKLASVQMLMARQLEKDDRALDVALYPVPHWQPHDGFKVDPALIYALARQESGFRTGATSSRGASGLMQIMPRTASMMKKSLNIDTHHNVNDPSFNMMLGQNYVLHLLDNGLVEGNLIYMLAAYNAGPARLMDWKKRIGEDDPLLFVESIPYGETRAYVMQVMTNYWIYSELEGRENITLAMLASGHWPSYITETPLASARAVDING